MLRHPQATGGLLILPPSLSSLSPCPAPPCFARLRRKRGRAGRAGVREKNYLHIYVDVLESCSFHDESLEQLLLSAEVCKKTAVCTHEDIKHLTDVQTCQRGIAVVHTLESCNHQYNGTESSNKVFDLYSTGNTFLTASCDRDAAFISFSVKT